MPKNIVKKTIGYNNVGDLVSQFNLYHLTTERAPIKGESYQDIKINEGFKINAVKEIVELIGGHKQTRERVGFKIRNEPQHHWFADRFVFNSHRNKWEYITGQSQKDEMKKIRLHFNKQ